MKKDNSVVKELTIEWQNQTIQIKINADGHAFIHTNGEVTKLHPDSPDVGDVMSDGSIYVGYIHDKHWYAAPKDLSLAMNFNQASKAAKDYESGGRKDYAIPPRAVMEQMYKHKDLIGNFDPDASYWTYTGSENGLGWQRQFKNGHEYNIAMRTPAKVRLVRSSRPANSVP